MHGDGATAGAPAASSIALRVRAGRREGARVLTLADKVPDLDKRLGLGVSPGQPGLLQLVGAPPPPLAPILRPAGHNAAIGRRMRNPRRSCPCRCMSRMGEG